MNFAIIIFLALLILLIRAASEGFSDEHEGQTPVPPITARLVEKYAFAGGTDQEIADRFQVDVKFLRQRYRGVLRVARALRKLALRGYQFDLAKKNGPMQMWLGRNELGQTNHPTDPGEPMPEIMED